MFGLFSLSLPTVMTGNSSLSPSSPLPSSSLPSPIGAVNKLYRCFNSTPATYSVTAFTITNVLILLPVYVFVLYLGLQRWRQQGPNRTMSHSDIFTYNMTIIDLLNVFGSILSCYGVHANLSLMVLISTYFLFITCSGHVLFHVLTCVECYLAVVHPITYLSLRKAKCIRNRNVAIVFIWLLCFAGITIFIFQDYLFVPVLLCVGSLLLLAFICFCCLSVLCVLIRPGPGEGSGDRKQADQSKLRAFYTMMAILAVMVFKFVMITINSFLNNIIQLEESENCILWLSIIWNGVPSSLLLPMLFLIRTGNLPCFKSNK